MMDEEARRDVSDARFADLLAGHCTLPRDSLAKLSGGSGRSSFRSGLVERVEAAWETPVDALRCAQVRVLVGQKFGLEWLARPVALFVWHHPAVACEHYAGDLTVACLRALREIEHIAPAEAAAVIEADHGWLEDEFGDDEFGVWEEARSVLNELRAGRSLH
jgi:hypothetical protein